MLTIGEQDFIAADLLDVTEGDDVGTMTLEEFIRRQLCERFLQLRVHFIVVMRSCNDNLAEFLFNDRIEWIGIGMTWLRL